MDITLFPPISLAPASLPLSAGQRLVTMGWGATKWAWGSDALLYTEVPFVPRDVCRRKQGNFPISHVCAGGAPDGADSCSGDSGGPLIIDGATDVQVGIVSFVSEAGGGGERWQGGRAGQALPGACKACTPCGLGCGGRCPLPRPAPPAMRLYRLSQGPSKCGKVGNIGYYTDVRYMRSWIDTAIAKYGLNAKKA